MKHHHLLKGGNPGFYGESQPSPERQITADTALLAGYPVTLAEGMAHVNAVSTALSTFGQQARTTIGEAGELNDAGTADLFTEISRGIDKWLWFVEAHAQAAT